MPRIISLANESANSLARLSRPSLACALDSDRGSTAEMEKTKKKKRKKRGKTGEARKRRFGDPCAADSCLMIISIGAGILPGGEYYFVAVCEYFVVARANASRSSWRLDSLEVARA